MKNQIHSFIYFHYKNSKNLPLTFYKSISLQQPILLLFLDFVLPFKMFLSLLIFYLPSYSTFLDFFVFTFIFFDFKDFFESFALKAVCFFLKIIWKAC